MKEEVWTELVPNEDAGFTYLASTRGNKCFGISTLPLLPSPLNPHPACSKFLRAWSGQLRTGNKHAGFAFI